MAQTRPRARAPGQRTSILYVLIGINVAVFLLWQVAQSSQFFLDLMAANFLVSLDAMYGGRVWTLLTSAVSHIDLGHLAFNMLALWVFGRSVELTIGWKRTLHLYVAGGIVASLGHVLFSLLAATGTPALGASGSVMALAVVYAALFPKRTLMINFILPVPAAIAVAGYLLLDVFGVFSAGSGVAHAAHLGGAAYGLAFFWIRIRPKLRPRARP